MRNFWTGVIVFGVILITIWLQLNVFNCIPFFGVKANMGIILVVSLSILCGQGVGITIGIIYGIFSDILFGKTFGIYTLLFFLIGFFCGKMSKGFSKENNIALAMITTATTAIFEILSCIMFAFIYQYEIEIFSMIKVIILECLYHILISRISFRFYSNLSEIINKGKKSYYLL